MRVSLLFLIGFAWSVGCTDPGHSVEGRLVRAEGLVMADPDSAAVVLDGIRHSEIHSRRLMARYDLLRTMVDDRLGTPHDSIVTILSARDYFREASAADSVLAIADFYMGRVYQDTGDREKALDAYFSARALSEKTTDNDFWKGRISYYIGYLYSADNDFAAATPFFIDAVTHFGLSGHRTDLAHSHHSLGFSRSMMGDYGSALESFSLSDSIYRELGSVSDLLRNAMSRAGVYLGMGDVRSADSALTAAHDEFNDGAAPTGHLPLASRIESAKNDPLGAVELLERYLDRSPDLSPQKQKSYRYLISQYLNDAGHYREAYLNLDRFVALSDSIYADRVVTVLREVEQRFERRELENEYRRFRKVATYQIAIFLICASVIIAGLVSQIRRRKRKYADLQADLEGMKSQMSEFDDLKETLSRVLDEKSGKQARVQQVLTDKIFHLQRLVDNLFLYDTRPEEFRERINTLIIQADREQYFGELHEVVNEKFGGIVDYLREHFPDLTEDEISLCCLICFGFTNNQIGILFGFTNAGSIFNRRHKLRKKMGLWPRYESLEAYLVQLIEDLQK